MDTTREDTRSRRRCGRWRLDMCGAAVFLGMLFGLSAATGALDLDNPVTVIQTGDFLQSLGFAAEGESSYSVWTQTPIGTSTVTLYFARSVDGGETYETATPLRVSGVSGVTNVLDPYVAARGSEVFVVWWEGRTDESVRIMMRRSADGGETFSSPAMVHNHADGHALGRTKVATAPGHVYVAWKGTASGEDHDLLLKVSTDAGATWEDVVELGVQTFTNTTVSLAAEGTSVFVAWTNGYRNGRVLGRGGGAAPTAASLSRQLFPSRRPLNFCGLLPVAGASTPSIRPALARLTPSSCV